MRTTKYLVAVLTAVAIEASSADNGSYRACSENIKVVNATSPRVRADIPSAVKITVDGKTVPSGSKVAKGTKLKVSYVPEEGYGFRAFTLPDGDGYKFIEKKSFSVTMPDGDLDIGVNRCFSYWEDYCLQGLCSGTVAVDPLNARNLIPVDYSGETWHVGMLGEYVGLELGGSNQLASQTTFTAKGLPKGLKIVRSASGTWLIEGVPTEACTHEDAERAPILITATGDAGNKVVFRLNLEVLPASGYAEKDVSCAAGVKNSITVPAWEGFKRSSGECPDGFLWDAATQTATFTPAAAGVETAVLYKNIEGLSGKTFKNVRTIRYVSVRKGSSDAEINRIPTRVSFTVGKKVSEDVASWFKGATDPAVAGLPSGLKFDAGKKLLNGKPKKAGLFVASVSKKVKGKTKKADVVVEIVAGTAPAIAYKTSSGAEGTALRVLPAGARDKTSFTVSPASASVKVTGLPKGVKYVKGKNGVYALNKTRMTAIGDYPVTVAVTANGVTTYHRYIYRVLSNPLAGEFRGYAVTTLGAGAVKIVVSERGRAQLTLQEGSLKNSKISADLSSVSGLDVKHERNGTFTYKFKLPASAKVGKRTVKVVLRSKENGSCRYADSGKSSIGKDSKKRGASSVFRAEGALSLSNMYDLCPDELSMSSSYYRYAISGSASNEGDGFYAYAEQQDIDTFKVTGRLPAGKKFSLTLPYTYRYEEKVAGFVPGVVTDADGLVYVIRPTLDETLFDPDQAGSVLVYGRKDVTETRFQGEYRYSRDKAVSKVSKLTDTGFLLTYELSGKYGGFTAQWNGNKLEVNDAVMKSSKYSSSTGLVTAEFTQGGATYTVYLLQTENPDGALNGIIKRVKGSKTTWGRASISTGKG